MLIEYTDHALHRMRERGVSKENVEETIHNPDSGYTTHQDREIAVRKYGDKYLKVIYENNKEGITVVTVYWTRRLQR